MHALFMQNHIHKYYNYGKCITVGVVSCSVHIYIIILVCTYNYLSIMMQRYMYTLILA